MSYDKTKTDPALGQRVHKHLVSVGVETSERDKGLSRKGKIDKIEGQFAEIVTTLGLDLTAESLKDTTNIVSNMIINDTYYRQY